MLVIDTEQTSAQARPGRLVFDALTKGNKLLALTSDNGGDDVRLVDLVSGKVEAAVRLNRPAVLARVDAKTGTVALVESDGHVSLRRPDLASVAAEFNLPAAATPIAISFTDPLAVRLTSSLSPEFQGKWNADSSAGVLAASSVDNDPLFIHLPDGKALGTFSKSKDGSFVRFIGGGQFLLMNGGNGPYIRDIAGVQMTAIANSRSTDISLNAMVDLARQSPIIDVGVSDDGAVLVTASKDGGIRVLHAGSAPRYGVWGGMPMPMLEPVASFDHGAQLGETATWSAPPALFVSPNGRFIASQSQGLKATSIGRVVDYDPMVRIWDVQKQGEIARFRPKGGMRLAFAREGDLAVSWSRPMQTRGNFGEDDAKADTPEITVWKLRSETPTAERPRTPTVLEAAEVIKQHAFNSMNGDLASGVAVSPDGKRYVWVGADGQLRTAEAGSDTGAVVEDLRPITHEIYEQLEAERRDQIKTASEMMQTVLGDMPTPVDPIAQFEDDGRKGENAAAGAHPDAPAPFFPLVMSENGCCALVLIGSTARVYDLAAKKLIADRKLRNYFSCLQCTPLGGQFPGDVVLSRDGRSFAVASTTWDGFANFIEQSRESAGQARQSRVYPARSIQIFSVDRSEPIGSLTQSITVSPVDSMVMPMIRPLAISQTGERLVLQRMTSSEASDQSRPGDLETDIALIDLKGGERFHTERRKFYVDNTDLSAQRDLWTKSAAFSADERTVLIEETAAACPLIAITTKAWMEMRVPSCPDLETHLTLWDGKTGKATASTVYLSAPHFIATAHPNASSPDPQLLGSERSDMAIGLVGENTAVKAYVETILNSDGKSRRLTVATEHVAVSDARIKSEICARLPAADRRKEWIRNSPEQLYPKFCED